MIDRFEILLEKELYVWETDDLQELMSIIGANEPQKKAIDNVS